MYIIKIIFSSNCLWTFQWTIPVHLNKATTNVELPESTNLFSLVAVDATTGKNELLG